jgi:acetyl-CoA carboxylase carboxyl transferase subunit alpha
MQNYLDFEKPVVDLENKIEELRRIADGKDVNITAEIHKLETTASDLRTNIFSRLTPWQITQIARHSDRPHTLDLIQLIMDDFVELHGDRNYADDPAVVAGLARFQGSPVVVIGHQKGKTTKERIDRNFGQPHPEGYRKALRVMRLGDRFHIPIITLIDTPGAYPGLGAEERGQSEAIAKNLYMMFKLKTPIISLVVGEGGSGGALALGVGDRVLMLEHSVYSVISPEGCAAILWKKAPTDTGPEDFDRASNALKLTSEDLKGLGVIDEIIPEPLGGAHKDHDETAENIKMALMRHLQELKNKTPELLVQERYDKFRVIGEIQEETTDQQDL